MIRQFVVYIAKHLKITGYTVAFAASLFLCTTNLYALPQGGVVSGGNVTISNPNATTTQINQASQKGIVDWQSYNVGSAEHVNYQQPNASSITLNRINPNNGPAQIYGSITANGQVWLVNPAGVWFGPTAHVDVAGLVASTANIRNEDFMAGQYHFTQSPDWHGAVINEGYIKTSQAGIVALVGSGVVNNGYIESQMGTVVLAAGSEFTVNFSGNELVSFTVDKEVMHPALDQNGQPLKDGIRNSGMISAPGGKVLVTAKTASQILDHAINMSGVIEAKAVGEQGGEIILGATGADVRIAGKLIASGMNAGEKGGKIRAIGNQINIVDNAIIDASGYAGGGEILIGGDAHGANPLIMNATSVYFGPGAIATADAISFGDGGKVVIWADNDTYFYGSISARGGAAGGNGGWVETSGKMYLDVAGAHVNTLAPKGLTGTWLLDPTNIYIATNQASATAAGMVGTNNSASTEVGGTFAATGAVQDSLLTLSSLQTALNTTGVIVSTDNASGTGVGNITVVDAINATIWSSGNSLTLSAANNIIINAAITAGNTSATLTLNAGGSITQSAPITVRSLTTSSATGTTLSSANSISSIFTASNTSSGNIVFNNTAEGFTLGAITQSGSGNINITNTGSMNASGAISSQAGSISVATLSPDANLRQLIVFGDVSTQGGSITLSAANPSSDNDALAVLSNISTGSGSNGSLTILGGGLTLQGSFIGGNGNVTFAGNGADFSLAAISFSSVQPIIISATGFINVSGNNISVGDLTLNGTGGIIFADSAAITSGGQLTFTGPTTMGNGAVTGSTGVTFTNTLTLTGSNSVSLASGNMTFNGIQGTDANLSLNATSGNIILNNTTNIGALSVGGFANLTNNGTINASSFTQQGGNNIFLGYNTLNVSGGVSISGSSVTGHVNVGSLFLNVRSANLIGTIGGASGAAAAARVGFIPNGSSLFFNNVRLVLPANATAGSTAIISGLLSIYSNDLLTTSSDTDKVDIPSILRVSRVVSQGVVRALDNFSSFLDDFLHKGNFPRNPLRGLPSNPLEGYLPTMSIKALVPGQGKHWNLSLQNALIALLALGVIGAFMKQFRREHLVDSVQTVLSQNKSQYQALLNMPFALPMAINDVIKDANGLAESSEKMPTELRNVAKSISNEAASILPMVSHLSKTMNLGSAKLQILPMQALADVSSALSKSEQLSNFSAFASLLPASQLSETQRKQLQALEESTAHLSQLQKSLPASGELEKTASLLPSVANKELVDDISLQLRDTASSIKGFSELMQSHFAEKMNENQKAYVNHILQNSNQMLKLISDMSNLSNEQSSSFPIFSEEEFFGTLSSELDGLVKNINELSDLIAAEQNALPSEQLAYLHNITQGSKQITQISSMLP
ncbi:MAG TPA: filamentous hemagglutinin N-terminal domain-containing protein [Gammaproteobacteria bacterium]|jgi:filamentous hemagglutinin family protein|nr:filamentous hemagglutinin N-terminal domain-containing protein [Gammaproteobacteria bacterium]